MQCTGSQLNDSKKELIEYIKECYKESKYIKIDYVLMVDDFLREILPLIDSDKIYLNNYRQDKRYNEWEKGNNIYDEEFDKYNYDKYGDDALNYDETPNELLYDKNIGVYYIGFY